MAVIAVNAGRLDRSLTLFAASTATDEFGQEVAGYAELATIPAQRLDMRTQDAARAGGRETFAMARYLIRWRSDVSTALRVAIDGKTYDILAVEETDRRATLILTLEEATRT